jgi:hypothetical protein
MFQIIPPNEKRFWKLFRHFLIPNAVFAGLICLVGAVAAACGGDAIFWDNRPVVGLEGVIVSIAYFPVVLLILTLAASWALFMDRQVLPAIWRAVAFWKRK